jgi:hypothetical protein
MGTYLYTRADVDGKIVHQSTFKTQAVRGINGIERIPPRLQKLPDGNVIVAGGIEEDPHHPREKLSDGQVSKGAGVPPPPPAPPTGNGNQ